MKKQRKNLLKLTTRKYNELLGEIVKLHNQGLSFREIGQSVWYLDESNSQKFISKSFAFKVVKLEQQKHHPN